MYVSLSLSLSLSLSHLSCRWRCLPIIPSQEGLRGNIEELREALADFLNDDDFESDRFKRMLYTFSLKFAGVLTQFDSGLRRDIRGVEKSQIKASVIAFICKSYGRLYPL